jgi:hypothetical protein
MEFRVLERAAVDSRHESRCKFLQTADDRGVLIALQ